MDINALRAFVEVAHSGSFSQASSNLFLTQPAISKRIASLENQLGLKLFDRIGKKVFLTEAGTKLLPKAMEVLQQTDDIQRLASNMDNQVSGPLILGTSHHVGLRRLPPVLKTFIKQYPDVNLDIRFMDSEEACRDVESGQLEIAIVTLPRKPSPDLVVTEVWHDPLAVMANKEHPLAKAKAIPFKNLGIYPAVIPGKGTYTRAILDDALNANKIKPEIAMSTNYLETLKMLAGIGLGWTLLPESMKDDEVIKLDIKGLQVSRSLGIVTNQQRTLSNPAIAIMDLCIG
jgi:DNA-binding transcriptional LysR family regulator